MVPRVQQQPLRAQHRHGRLLGDKGRGLERGLDDLAAAPLDDARDEADGQGFGGGEVARG